jgi:hypothetical protein
MSPLPSGTQSSKMFLPWFAAGLFDQLFGGLQDPVGTLAFHAPTLSVPGIALAAEERVTEQAKEMAINKGRDVVLACFRSIASSPFSPPSHGNVYPPLDYAALDAKGIIRAVRIQSAVAERLGSFSKPFSTQSEDLRDLNQHQLACANGLECLRVPYAPEFSKMIAFAAVSVQMRSGLTEKAGKIAPVTEATPVLERYLWDDGAGGLESGR